MVTRFEIWTHNDTNDHYLVCLNRYNKVLAACGPIDWLLIRIVTDSDSRSIRELLFANGLIDGKTLTESDFTVTYSEPA